MATNSTRNLIARIAATLLVALACIAGAGQANAQSVSVGIRITVDEDSAAVVRAWRRAQGLDAPDAQADAQVREILARRTAVRVAAEQRLIEQKLAAAKVTNTGCEHSCVASQGSL